MPDAKPSNPSTSAPQSSPDASPPRPPNFIEQIVEADNRPGPSGAPRWGVWTRDDAGPVDAPGPAGDAARARLGKPRVHTRFPPEPNGYLHIGHAKSITLNHGLAAKYNGRFNLRFDDTNPAKEEREFVEAIKSDLLWLGADFNPETGANAGGVFWASDYFAQMYEWAEELVRKGRAYVCSLTADEVSKRRGTPQVPATSPDRDRPIEDSIRLLREMRDGKHPDGAYTLRAKIDLASPNFNLRDPVLYRISHAEHHNTGRKWCIYPMYDWAHGFEDSIEGITHSICTLEFENHRPLYDWFIDSVNVGRHGGPALRAGLSTASTPAPGPDAPPSWGPRIHHAQQIEFAKGSLTYLVTSKRLFLRLVREGLVRGWDDPRMPTVAGFRRRGYTAAAIRDFWTEVGVTKTESLIDYSRLENTLRDHLNKQTPRRMGVLRPLKVTIENYPDGGPEGKTEHVELVNNPENPAAGMRTAPFGRTLYIERDDFMEDPPKKFFRLAPGAEVRLRGAYWIRCERVVKDAAGDVTELICTYDPQTAGGESPPPDAEGKVRKVKATLHWVSAAHAVPAEVRLFDRLFNAEEPGKRTGEPADDLNPNSLEIIERAMLEPAVLEDLLDYAARATDLRSLRSKSVPPTDGPTSSDAEPAPFNPATIAGITWPDAIPRYQFERLGYFALDPDTDLAAPTPRLVFNRTATLKDEWAKQAAKG
ncbi:MAG: glutamine--tRNA ligase [Phycisphaeraceae bacterium]|nr:glutamine--tRNA ligase [Phycisphaeraceae bacterium]